MHKVCYIIGQLNRAGAEGQLSELVKNIDKDKFIPIVISLSQGGYWFDKLKKFGVQVIEIPRKKNIEITRLHRVFKILKTIKPDIVHTYMYSANSYGRIAALCAGIKIIIASERSMPDIGKDKSIYESCVDTLLSFISHGVICNSFKASHSLINNFFIDSQKVFTVQNGINADNFRREPISSGNKLAKKVVATVGNLRPVKNHILFLDIAKIVLGTSSEKSIKFLIIGKGELRSQLEEYSKKLGIENNVIFAGQRMDIAELLRGVDIFVMTSLYEGVSNAIMEAMSSGLPVVATDVGGNSELVVDGKTGYLCPSNQANLLADKVITLINDEQKAKQMGNNGSQRIISEFNMEKMIRETEKIYLHLVNKNGSM